MTSTNPEYILCNNSWEGMCFMMNRALKRNELEVDTKNIKDHLTFFKTHNVLSCPVLLIIDNGKVVDRIDSVEEIIKSLKNKQEIKP